MANSDELYLPGLNKLDLFTHQAIAASLGPSREVRDLWENVLALSMSDLMLIS